MIRIVQGNPGSGKSFYAVNYLAKFCTYDSLYQEHKLNEGVLVITNIEGLRIKHLNLSELVERFGIENFFTVENFERIQEKYKSRHIILVIDEAQKLFDSKFFDKTVFYFFQYHRHLGIDVFLLTQSVSTIARQLIPLAEFVIEAQPRSKAFVGVFRYKFKDIKGNFMYSQAVRKKPELFKMYKSFNSDEAEKPRNVIVYWCAFACVFVVASVIGFKVIIGSLKGDTKKTTKPGIQQKYQPQIIEGHQKPISDVAPVSLPAQIEVPPVQAPAAYWQTVPVMGRLQLSGKSFVMLTDGSRCEKFKNYDWYSSTAQVPAEVAARVPVMTGKERREPDNIPVPDPGSLATGQTPGVDGG